MMGKHHDPQTYLATVVHRLCVCVCDNGVPPICGCHQRIAKVMINQLKNGAPYFQILSKTSAQFTTARQFHNQKYTVNTLSFYLDPVHWPRYSVPVVPHVPAGQLWAAVVTQVHIWRSTCGWVKRSNLLPHYAIFRCIYRA